MRHSIGAALSAALAAVLLCSPLAAASPIVDQATSPALSWATVSTPTSPPARNDPAMTYDGASGYLLMFGGTTPGGQVLDDTWEFDGTTWTELQPAQSPPPLSGASMAFDSSLGQLLLFGGSTPSSGGLTPTSETWAWNGASWTLQSPATSPPARSDASLTNFDSAAGGSFVLFGGIGAQPADASGTPGTDSTTTTAGTVAASATVEESPGPATTTTIPSVQTASASSDDGDGGGSTTLDDTWTWNGSDWTLEPASATDPPARAGAASTWNPTLGEVVLFGGSSDGTNDPGSLLGDQWAWNGQGWEQLTPTSSPPARRGATLTNDPVSGADVLIEGWTASGPSDDVWVYASSSWTAVALANSPAPSNDQGAAWDAGTSQIITFGGSGQTGAVSNTTAPVVTPPTTTASSPGATTTGSSPTTAPAAPAAAAVQVAPSGQAPRGQATRGHTTNPTTSTSATAPTTTVAPPLGTTVPPVAPLITKPTAQPPAIVAITSEPSGVSSGSRTTAPIAASRTSSHPGQRVMVTGSGYAPRARVTVWFHSTPVLLGTTTADATGHFDLDVTIPASAAPGDHHFEAQGLTSTGKVQAFTIALHVTLPGPPGRSHTETVVLILVTLGVPLATWGGFVVSARRRKRMAVSA